MVLRRARGLLVMVALVAVVGSAQAATGPSAPRSDPRAVAPGETLSEVAGRLGVSVAALARANRIADPDRVRAGRLLVVPGRAARRSAGARLPEELRRQPSRLALMPRFDAAARAHGVPADLLKAVTWMESGWQNDKVSSTNALGIGQLMPDTVTFVNDQLLERPLDPRRAEHNIVMSARFLRYLLDQTGGDTALAVAAYYQGLASVRRDGTMQVTQHYVASVLALRGKF